jgi:aldose 1-epimerase
MTISTTLGLVVLISVGSSLPASAQQYVARHTSDVVQLEDTRNQTIVSIIPSVGNIAFEMKVKGHNVLRWPYASVEDFKANPGMSALPFVGPWMGRLDEQAFYANGRRYAFDMEMGNVRGAHPIHGFLGNAEWTVVEALADGASAWVTSRLEFFRHPEWMAQFPFAHTLEMTHRLRDGALDISIRVDNLSVEPMPVAIGFHPYFQLSDAPRDTWTITLAARTEWVLAADKIPTGETRPIEQRFANPRAAVLRDHDLDHVFGDLTRDASGGAAMAVSAGAQRIDVVFGPNFRAAVVYAPRGREFICFEPMAAITDALNLAQRGVYKDLQHIAPGDTWQERFSIRPSGF